MHILLGKKRLFLWISETIGDLEKFILQKSVLSERHSNGPLFLDRYPQ